MALTLEQADKVVDSHDDLHWDGWNIVIVNKGRDGYFKKNGIFTDGQWAVRTVVKPNARGEYNLPAKYTA